MSKHTHVIVNAATNESITDQKVTTANFRDICRAYLTAPEHFGERLQVVRDRTADNAGEVIFDVTSIKYSSGKVRMTLFTEFERQQKLHEATAAKAAEREAAKAAKAEAKKAAKAEQPAEDATTAKAEKPAKKAKSAKKTAKIAAE